MVTVENLHSATQINQKAIIIINLRAKKVVTQNDKSKNDMTKLQFVRDV